MVVIESLYMISTGLKRTWRLKLHPLISICAICNYLFLIKGGSACANPLAMLDNLAV